MSSLRFKRDAIDQIVVNRLGSSVTHFHARKPLAYLARFKRTLLRFRPRGLDTHALSSIKRLKLLVLPVRSRLSLS